jgi:hypothetical protein
MKRLWLLAAAVIAAASFVGTALSSPATPSFDRGLPTANLNNAAGANRSNVAWSNGNDYISGDTFSLGASGQTWYVSAIRTWNIGPTVGGWFGDTFSSDTLYLGTTGTGTISPYETGTVAPGSNTDSNPNITHTPVTYSDGSNYQGTSGSFRQIWQNDFKTPGLTVNGGQTYYFGVDGATSSYYWFNHASNAALSGSPQQGADGKWIAWAKSDLATPNLCDSGAPSGGVCDGGWDKSSDINVQVFASQVATSKDGCKNDGWKTLVRSDGSTFKNQGDCIQYVNTGK